MNSAEVIRNSIYWQEYILRASHNPKQRERARKALEKLNAELSQIQGE
jgi:hypothetical protein